ncbi:hypothetical protein EON81_23075 [bacterium]|nr:MAG: hypothetical protein EON81_23075 [bacterium]
MSAFLMAAAVIGIAQNPHHRPDDPVGDRYPNLISLRKSKGWSIGVPGRIEMPASDDVEMSTEIVESSGNIYLFADKTLVALSSESGQTRWRSSSAAVPDSPPPTFLLGPFATPHTVVYFSSDSGLRGQMNALDARTGKRRWSAPWTLAADSRRIVLSHDHVLGLTGEGRAEVLDLRTGKRLGAWADSIPKDVFSRLFPSMKTKPVSLGNLSLMGGQRINFQKTPRGTPRSVSPWMSAHLAHYDVERYMDYSYAGTNGVALLVLDSETGAFRDLWKERFRSVFDENAAESHFYGRLIGADQQHAYLLQHHVKGSASQVDLIGVSFEGSVVRKFSDIDGAFPSTVKAKGPVYQKGAWLFCGSKALLRIPNGSHVLAVLPSGILFVSPKSKLFLTPFGLK